MHTYVVETNQLSRRFGKKISVQQMDLKVPQGEIYGFLGPNGAGKTTTIRMLLGLIKPTEGSIRLFGKELNRHRMSILKRVGSLVESPSYYGHLTGYENLNVIARLLGLPSPRISEVLKIVRLQKDAHRKVKGYSLGMKQRLGIAAALIAQPELLILDEPTNGLDPAGIQEIREMIIELPKQTGVTVLVSSHLLSEIDQMATYVGIISDGRLIFQDTIESLRNHSQVRLELEVNRPADACRLLQKQGWNCYLEQKSLCLETTDREQTAAIVESLVLSKFSVYRVAENKKSLEDIFIGLTGKERSL
ncbi:ABC transporter ATP-binding protein [Paenactinomyces guangxiensis]|uniref:ABC transporter ATP-binding protein n=1 Tax=Paenactinomyces guangxiensis TaxID=1490290 RepID=A0A7W2A863_9BACL|nr:ABC transporter ATP-binding protein [Paenactinomyces guangxiensis]MBA4493847.1 ABC transporter ATP-binding protein [Paenactinomyces guangxiensis]MBH8591313.1 ABC transporter ATP-binding protein [Paenactinomyces guangxiensis]